MGDPLAVLLRVPQRGDQPSDLARRGVVAGRGVEPVAGLDRLAIEPADRRNRPLPRHPRALRVSAPGAWSGRPRRTRGRDLPGTRCRRAAHAGS